MNQFFFSKCFSLKYVKSIFGPLAKTIFAKTKQFVIVTLVARQQQVVLPTGFHLPASVESQLIDCKQGKRTQLFQTRPSKPQCMHGPNKSVLNFQVMPQKRVY